MAAQSDSLVDCPSTADDVLVPPGRTETKMNSFPSRKPADDPNMHIFGPCVLKQRRTAQVMTNCINKAFILLNIQGDRITITPDPRVSIQPPPRHTLYLLTPQRRHHMNTLSFVTLERIVISTD
ncbi:unnamed protein product [Pleuronectes platessa]|uniref:Uncharacterized protein n=1 Tax=Pleuronectes platessa TaxID=8262 RepID=A0A9N7UQX6_PLEPL|nr:unnamed protein product [Pleuronectes platessa]